MKAPDSHGFWHDAFAWRGSITPQVLPRVLGTGLIAAGICGVAWYAERVFQVPIGLEVTPFEISGGALSLLLILRTNSGYDRWWEARKLWGGIVNQCRNIAISGLTYGPKDPPWRDALLVWTAAYPHVACASLRDRPLSPAGVALLGPVRAAAVAAAPHMPSFAAMRLAETLHAADMDRFAFLQIDRERAALIDHLGACERILKTPLPRVYGIKVRRFIMLFLFALPFALLHRIEADWLVPLLTMMFAYPLFALDQIGIELQNPFSTDNLSHLPLDEIADTIERNVMGLLKADVGP